MSHSWHHNSSVYGKRLHSRHCHCLQHFLFEYIKLIRVFHTRWTYYLHLRTIFMDLLLARNVPLVGKDLSSSLFLLLHFLTIVVHKSHLILYCNLIDTFPTSRKSIISMVSKSKSNLSIDIRLYWHINLLSFTCFFLNSSSQFSYFILYVTLVNLRVFIYFCCRLYPQSSVVLSRLALPNYNSCKFGLFDIHS